MTQTPKTIEIDGIIKTIPSSVNELVFLEGGYSIPKEFSGDVVKTFNRHYEGRKTEVVLRVMHDIEKADPMEFVTLDLEIDGEFKPYGYHISGYRRVFNRDTATNPEENKYRSAPDFQGP